MVDNRQKIAVNIAMSIFVGLIALVFLAFAIYFFIKAHYPQAYIFLVTSFVIFAVMSYFIFQVYKLSKTTKTKE